MPFLEAGESREISEYLDGPVRPSREQNSQMCWVEEINVEAIEGEEGSDVCVPCHGGD